MQTPEPHETPEAATPDASAEDRPGVDALLQAGARGDRAAFSAFYDATVPWVHGMAVAMSPSEDDAADATLQTYLTAWEEAGEAELDLSDQDDPAERERRVFAWLGALCHRVMVGRLRASGRHAARSRVGGPAEPPAELVGTVDPAAFEAVRLAWLGGFTDAQVAEALDRPRDETRTLLRDGVQQLVAARRTAHADGGTPAASPADAGHPALGSSVAEDMDAGRGAELADLSALHTLDVADHTAAAAAAQTRGPGELARWRTRVDAGRRALVWAFRDVVAEPPSALLDTLLARLPAQDEGLALVADRRAPRHPVDRLRAVKIALLSLLGLAVLAVGVYAAWSQFSADGIAHRVREADDLYTTSEYPATGGGVMQGFLSAEENSGFVRVDGMPQLEKGRTYQVWIYPQDGSAPSSLGTYRADEFDEPVSFRGLDRFAAVSMTEEPAGGSDEPTAEDVLLGLDLHPTSTLGPQYGGKPSGN